MGDNKPESSKEFTVTLNKDLRNIPTYDLCLVRGTSEYMEIQLAQKTETDTEINVHVESIFRISKKGVPHFVRQFIKYLNETIPKQEAQGQPND